MPRMQISKSDAIESVTLGDELLNELVTINVANFDRIFFELANTVTALDQFEISARNHDQGAFNIIVNAGGDFTSPVKLMIDASGDLAALGVATGWFIMDVRAIQHLRIRVARASGSDSVITGTYNLA